jgi:peptidoglycan biosynthesis protein MviN/MurJ (putative lipid II flippase)
MNLSLIFGITVLANYSKTPAHGLAWGVFLAGVAQLVWLFGALMRTDMKCLLTIRPVWVALF